MKQSLIIKTGVLFSVAGILIFSFAIGSGKTENPEKARAKHDHHEDMGKKPWVVDIEEATIDNRNYRAAIWSGEYMQLVLMSLKPGEIIDLEVHEDHDQFIRIEQGEARIRMGKSKDNLTFNENVSDDWVIMIPAGYWHEVRNTGNNDLKVYTLYAPSEHPQGTVQETYEDATGHHH